MAPEANTLQGVVNDTIRDLRTIHAHIDELVGQPSASEATAAELGLAEAVSTGRDLTIKALERVAALHRIIGSLG
jgi:low affinity Fe/Cu permease